MKHLLPTLAAAAWMLSACNAPTARTEATASAATPLWLGADISWYTQYEQQGRKFYDTEGREREINALMAEMGMNAVRLRVWVDPSEHHNWCNKYDLLNKSLRAKAHGMEVMVDFHYSDWWADPAKQYVPASWQEHDLSQLCQDVAAHTTEVLQLLKDNGVEPRWVQIGNETSNGMLWPIGRADADSCRSYAALFKAGCRAAKQVLPQIQTIVHLDNGWKPSLYDWNLGGLRANGAEWDVIGMSLYPYWAQQSDSSRTAAQTISDCMANIRRLGPIYNCPVLITEVGFEVDDSRPEVMEQGREQLRWIIEAVRDSTDGICQGVFYWEPECRPSQYRLGAFHEDGSPTVIMEAFRAASAID